MRAAAAAEPRAPTGAMSGILPQCQHMTFDSRPGGSGAEHQDDGWLKEAAREIVAEKIAYLEIGLDLRRHPEINSRLAELGSHFEDSRVMAQMIRTLYGPLRQKLDLTDTGPERLMRAAVLHDIGKSGPPGVETGFHDAVHRLFIPPKHPFAAVPGGQKQTIRDYVAAQQLPDGAAIISELQKAGIDPDQEAMIAFWRRHAGWTHELLASEIGPDIDEDTVKIAASHHLFEDQDPARLELAKQPAETHALEILEEAELLAVVDKYQASRQRGGLRHEEAVGRLNALIAARTDLPETLRQKFRTIVEIIDGSRNEIEQYFGSDAAK